MFPDEIHELWQRAQGTRESRPCRHGSAAGIHVYPLYLVLPCARCSSMYHRQFMKHNRYSKHAVQGQPAGALRWAQIPRKWRSQIQRLLQAPQLDEVSEQRARLERMLEKMLEKLRYQHLCEAIDDETFRQEVRSIKARLGSLAPRPPPPVEALREPVDLLRSAGRIAPRPALRRREDGMFLYLSFSELASTPIEVSGQRIQSIAPHVKYREPFAISRATSDSGVGAAERT